MSTPTHAQRLKGDVRAAVRSLGEVATGELLADVAAELGLASLVAPMMGAGEAADVLHMDSTNLKKLRPRLEPVYRFRSGPVYLASDVMAAKERREQGNRAWEEAT